MHMLWSKAQHEFYYDSVWNFWSKKFKTVLGQKKKNNPIIKPLHNVSQDSIWQANKAKKIWKPKPVVSNHILKCYR